MTNEQFRQYIEQKRNAIEAELKDCDHLSTSAIAQLNEQRKMLESARKIMTYGTGPERRRFRRDYERRLAFKISLNKELESLRLANGLVKIELEG